MIYSEDELRELKEAAKDRIHVQTLDEVAGAPIETLGMRAEEALLRELRDSSRFEKSFRQKHGVFPSQPTEEVVRQHIEHQVQAYLHDKETRADEFRTQAYLAMRLAASRGYISGERQIPLVMTDRVLASVSGVGGHSMYDHERRRVVIEHNVPIQVVAHEVGHFLAQSSTDEHQIGFSRMEQSEDGRTSSRRNAWFDEGVTVLWEEEAGVQVVKRDAEDPYAGFRNVVQFIMRETRVSFDELFRGYFQQEDVRKIIDERIQTRFGVGLDQLDVLSLRLDPEWKMQVLQGLPVSVRRPSEGQPELQKKVRELVRLFPHVTIK